MPLNQSRKKLFREVTQAVGVFGNEKYVSQVLKKYYEPLCDEILYDNLGSIIAHKKCGDQNPLKVLVLAHMDEVGFRIGQILDDGTIKFNDLPSGIWDQTLMAQRVYVQTDKGELIDGVIDTIPPHRLTPELREKPMKATDMFVDIGCKSKEEVYQKGIKLNNSVVLRGDFVELNGGERLLSKAFDNRYGCILGIEILQSLKNVKLPYDLYVGASVQEEAGLRGATTVANMIQPDFVIILDCSPASDMGGNKSEYGQLGKGVLSRFVDGAMIAFPALLDYQRVMCDKMKVPYQYYISLGGTDAGVVHKANGGTLTLTHCICARNIHTNSSIIDLNDYEGAKKVLLAILKDLNRKKVAKLQTLNR